MHTHNVYMEWVVQIIFLLGKVVLNRCMHNNKCNNSNSSYNQSYMKLNQKAWGRVSTTRNLDIQVRYVTSLRFILEM